MTGPVARDLMTPDVVTVPPEMGDATVTDVADVSSPSFEST